MKGIDGFFDKFIIINYTPRPIRYFLCAMMLLGPGIVMIAVLCCGEEEDEEEGSASKKEVENKDGDSKKKGGKKVEREKIE